MNKPSEASKRDSALMAAIALGRFVHLTFLTGKVEQGWVHVHDGRLYCCASECRDRCDIIRREIADKLYDGVMREYPPMDVENLIRVDAAIVGSGHYVPIWHHQVHSDRRHVIDRHSLACCPDLPF